ncbi:MAG: RNA methyltransferase, partial [Fervidobacterium pennivorans]
WKKSRKEALKNLQNLSEKLSQKIIKGSDIDCQIIQVAQANMKVASKIFQTPLPVEFSCLDFKDLPVFTEKAWVISNLPYGQRLDDGKVIKDIKVLREKFPNANFYLLHPDRDFEKIFGKATKKIRFQNSGLWTYLFMYY